MIYELGNVPRDLKGSNTEGWLLEFSLRVPGTFAVLGNGEKSANEGCQENPPIQAVIPGKVWRV